jgi:hypothetical protein
MFHIGQRIRSLNGRSQGAIVKQGPDHVLTMLTETEVKRQWWVNWDAAPAGTQPQLEIEDTLVPTETTG